MKYFNLLLRVFDEDGSNSIDFEEFMLASNFNSSSPEDKLGLVKDKIDDFLRISFRLDFQSV